MFVCLFLQLRRESKFDIKLDGKFISNESASNLGRSNVSFNGKRHIEIYSTEVNSNNSFAKFKCLSSNFPESFRNITLYFAY